MGDLNDVTSVFNRVKDHEKKENLQNTSIISYRDHNADTLMNHANFHNRS
jgi:hypothetical protein